MITVITGPPCSGKTSYVREHAGSGDIVVDFDAIARAFGSSDGHGHDPELSHVTVAAWLAAVDALTAARHDKRAWIIDSVPSPRRAERYRQVGATVVALLASREELHRRAEADGRPLSCHRLIDAMAGGHDDRH